MKLSSRTIALVALLFPAVAFEVQELRRHATRHDPYAQKIITEQPHLFPTNRPRSNNGSPKLKIATRKHHDTQLEDASKHHGTQSQDANREDNVDRVVRPGNGREHGQSVHDKRSESAKLKVDADRVVNPGHASHAQSAGEGLGYSLCLMGAVAFNMSLLYLVNNSQAGVVFATWQVLSLTLSIFIAVLAYVTIRSITVDVVATGPVSTVVASLALFVTLYVSTEALLYLLKAPEYQEVLHSGAAVCCHLTGFAACYGFGDLLKLPLIANELARSIVVVFIAVLALVALTSLARRAHKWVEGLHQAPREHLDDLSWEETMELMENEAIAMCIGFLLVQVVATAIRGSPSSSDANAAPTDISQKQAYMILAAAIIFAILTLAGTFLSTRVLKWYGLKGVDTYNFESYAAKHVVSLDVRFVMIMHSAMGVAMAWSVLLWTEWQVYTLDFHGPRSAGCMLVALCSTLLSFALVFVLDYTADHLVSYHSELDPEKVVRSMLLTLGIVIGFAWERAFHVGLHDVSHALIDSAELQSTITNILACVLILIVTPAWAMYVFPMVEFIREAGEAGYASSPWARNISRKGTSISLISSPGRMRRERVRLTPEATESTPA